MTLTDEQLEEIKTRAEAATPGPWYHCQPFQTVPAQRTIHGPVPKQRVDYVSTWEGPGTPNGHSVVAHMDGREAGMRSKDMAFIAAANPAVVLALLSALEAERQRADEAQMALHAMREDRDSHQRLAISAQSELTTLKARVGELEGALRIARRLCENINEFGAVTDEEIHDAADNAIGAALEGASHG